MRFGERPELRVVEAGVLLNSPGGEHQIQVTQQPLPLAWRYHIARADVADVFLAALENEEATGTTLKIWGRATAGAIEWAIE